LINIGDNLDIGAAMIIQRVTSVPRTASSHATVSIHNGSQNPELIQRGPYVFIDVEGTDSTAVSNAAVSAREEVYGAARSLQDELGVQPQERVRLTDVAPVKEPVIQQGSLARGALIAGVLSVTAALLAAAAADSIVTARTLFRSHHVDHRAAGRKT
jgi:hypothetical protein